MELNLFSYRKINLKESLAFLQTKGVHISLGIYKNLLQDDDFITTKKLSAKKVLAFVAAYEAFVNATGPERLAKKQQLYWLILWAIDSRNHSFVEREKKIKLTWGQLNALNELFILLAAGLYGFFYSILLTEESQ